MIKVEANNGHVDINIKGRITEIKSDTIIIINAIRDAILDENEDCVEDYKEFVENILPKLVFKTSAEVEEMIHEKIEQFAKGLAREIFL